MRLCYVLLSPTFGMHQYTADLANRMAAAGHEVTLITTSHYPRDRYSPQIKIVTPLNSTNTGLSPQIARLDLLADVFKNIIRQDPEVIHLTGPHLWNPLLMRRLKRIGLPIIHSLHDLEPHEGQQFNKVLHLWNHSVLKLADYVLVHGRVYQELLLRRGYAPEKIWMTPLLHLFLGYDALCQIEKNGYEKNGLSHEGFALFLGRLEAYKGLPILLDSFSTLNLKTLAVKRLIVAGQGNLSMMWAQELPDGVELLNRLVEDKEAVDLFRSCSLLVLPYTSATQSALIGAAYYFHKPVLVTDSGALSEYVTAEKTGFIVPAGDRGSLSRTLTKALADPEELQSMGAAGRDWYDQQRWEEHQSLIHLYNFAANRFC